jgi:exodeoxyribonuclease V gamma subunit
MNGITIHASNRMEALLDALARKLARPPGDDPLEPETIVVQSKGMQRWLSWRLAERLGVFANARFPFPNALVAEWFEAATGRNEGASRYAKDAMAWRLMALLPPLLDRPAFDPLRGYLGTGVDGLKAFQLASRVADAFDQYTLYRPDTVLGWDAGEGDDWQAILWRALSAGCEGGHRAAVRRRFMASMAASAPPPGMLPARISVFGIPSMPRFHFDIFQAVARHCEVNLFFLNPSAEYWGDIVSPKALVKARAGSRMRRRDPEAEHLTVGHPLLASLGKLGRDFFNLLIESGECVEGETGFVDPAESSPSVLSALQSDMLRLVDRSAAAGEGQPPLPPFPAGDGSLRIHAVHGPTRELEVLHDQLLDLFERLDGLQPHDIVVMTPDIDRYAPFVSAVFGSIPTDDPRHIPWSVSDRSAASENEAARAFLKIVSLAGSRFGAGEIAGLLELPAIARKFGFEPGEIERINGWIAETRIRWGIDATDRAGHGVPAFPENSWKAGFDRLLLGYALRGDDESLYRGVLPHEGVEGGDALLLGRFVECFRALAAAARDLETPRTPAGWSAFLAQLLDALVDESDEAGEAFAEVRSRVGGLERVAAAAGYDAPTPVEVVRHWLRGAFGAERGGRGFLSRGVTFCEMLPMRSIPFRVVALVGMDNGAFPRQDRPPGFDLISAAPQPGDRSLRDEDRYLFLEALLSARDCFYVSYVGRSLVDNGDLPPSVLVSELIDAVSQGYAPAGPGEAPVEERLVVRHPLQPFSPAYFGGGSVPGEGPFSYSAENLEALRAREACRRPAPKGETGAFRSAAFVRDPLPPPADAWRHLSLGDLKRFFRGPSEFFLARRIGIHLDRETAATDDCEPFTLDGLDKYRFKQAFVERVLEGRSAGPLASAWLAGGAVPPGLPGRRAIEAAAAEAETFAGSVAAWHAEPALPPVDVDLVIGPFRLTGRIDGLREGGLVRTRCAALKAKDRLDAWIDHLALQAQVGSRLPTRLAGDDVALRIAPVTDPASALEGLLDLYWRGLVSPVPFFGEGSMKAFEAIRSGKKTAEGALDDFLRDWADAPGNQRSWEALAFGESAEGVEAGAFAAVAASVFGPISESVEGAG